MFTQKTARDVLFKILKLLFNLFLFPKLTCGTLFIIDLDRSFKMDFITLLSIIKSYLLVVCLPVWVWRVSGLSFPHPDVSSGPLAHTPESKM